MKSILIIILSIFLIQCSSTQYPAPDNISNIVGEIFADPNKLREFDRYFPDIFIPKDNKIIEVKSVRTMMLHLETNIIKKIRCLEMGFQFEFRIYDNKMNSIDEKEFL